MKATKIIALCLCLLLCGSVFLVACGGEGDESSKSTVSTEKVTTGYDPSTGKYVVEMPEFTWDKDEFVILINSNEVQTTYFSEEIVPDLYSTTDTKLNDAVRDRNYEIEEKYGVTIKAEVVGDVASELRESVTSGLQLYDAAMPFMPGAATLAQEDSLYNLYDFSDYFHFDQPWWDQSAEEALTVDNKLFFTTGDISIMQKIVSIAVTFNKKMLSEYFPGEDLYQMVVDKEWTFDKMIEMGREVTSDTDGKAGMTYEDTWGLSSSFGDASMFYLASGNKYIEKDGNDLPVLAFGAEEVSISLSQTILEKLQLIDDWAFHCNNATGDIWVISLDVFGQNRALFRTSAFSAIKKLRQYDDAEEFGLIPMPLMTADQDTYYTPCNIAYAYGVVIPSDLEFEDAKFSAYMLEVMAVGAKNYVTPAYYESTLKQRDLKDEESEIMLEDYIFSNIVYDLGISYNFGGISGMLTTLMSTSSTDVASSFEEIKGAAETAIEDCLEKFSD